MSDPRDQESDDEQGSSPNMVGGAREVQDRRANPYKQSEDTRQPAADADWADGFNDER